MSMDSNKLKHSSLTQMMASTLLIMASAFFVSCGQQEITRYQESKPKVVTHAPQDSAEDYHWTLPANWKSLPASGMRLASFAVPFEGQEGDGSLIRLSGGAGGELANVNRWRGQINLDAYDDDGLAAQKQDRKGAWPYSYIKIVNPKMPEKAILAAIFTCPDTTLFVKLTCSSKGADAAEPDFIAFCDSIHEGHSKH